MKNKSTELMEIILGMDKDCAVRTIFAILGGEENFLKQFSVECNVMSIRTAAMKNLKTDKNDDSSEEI